MKPFLALFFCIFNSVLLLAQDSYERLDLSSTDSLYREDQLYFGFHINLMDNLPDAVRQSGLSGGISAGFIRDMPINKRRNLALGLGLGFSGNTYGHNLFVGKDENGNGVFIPLNREDFSYTSNRFSTYVAEIPFQFRWRTSTPEKSSFYRIYAGFTLGYLYYFKSTLQTTEGSSSIASIPELNRWRTGIHLSIGSNFVNFHVQYNFNALFDAQLTNTNDDVGIEIIKFGFIFYML